MLPRRLLSALAAAALLIAAPGPAEALNLGQPAPAFNLPRLGAPGQLDTALLRDKRAQLVVFWAST